MCRKHWLRCCRHPGAFQGALRPPEVVPPLKSPPLARPGVREKEESVLITGVVPGCLRSQLGPGQPARAAWRLACAPADMIQQGCWGARGRASAGATHCGHQAPRLEGADSGGGAGGMSPKIPGNRLARLVSSVDPQLELA